MVIYKKMFRRYATSRRQMAFKINILIADTILAKPGPYQVLRFEGGKYVFIGERFYNHMFNTNFSGHNKIWGGTKIFGVTAPECPSVSAGLGRTVARKSSTGGHHVCARGLDILKIYIYSNSQHEQHLQIVQNNRKYFPVNTHNRLVVSNQKFFEPA